MAVRNIPPSEKRRIAARRKEARDLEILNFIATHPDIHANREEEIPRFRHAVTPSQIEMLEAEIASRRRDLYREYNRQLRTVSNVEKARLKYELAHLKDCARYLTKNRESLNLDLILAKVRIDAARMPFDSFGNPVPMRVSRRAVKRMQSFAEAREDNKFTGNPFED